MPPQDEKTKAQDRSFLISLIIGIIGFAIVFSGLWLGGGGVLGIFNSGGGGWMGGHLLESLIGIIFFAFSAIMVLLGLARLTLSTMNIAVPSYLASLLYLILGSTMIYFGMSAGGGIIWNTMSILFGAPLIWKSVKIFIGKN